MGQQGLLPEEKNSMPGDKVFLDTNILVYGYDTSAGKKHKIAQKIVVDLWDSGLGILSTQVLQEFYVTVTAKAPKPLSTRHAREIVYDFLKWNVILNDGESILDAVDIQSRYKYSFWDSLIIQAARRGGAAILFSEDLSEGQVIDEVVIKNPFGE